MSIWGEQWVCILCTWHNVFVRQNCRHCNAPRSVSAERNETGEVLTTFPPAQRIANPASKGATNNG